MIIYDIPNEEYHASEGLSSSKLKILATSTPAHFKYAGPRTESEAMKKGTALHCAVLEPAEFDQRYTLMPEGLDRRTKEGKQIWAEIEASGKTPLKSDTMEMVLGVQRSVLSHPFSMEAFQHPLGVSEASIFWEEFGIKFRARPDYMIPPYAGFKNGLILDFKKSADASESGFERYACKFGYHIQAWLYSHAFYLEFKTIPDFVFLAAEAEPPYLCQYFRPTEEFLLAGREGVQRGIEVYQECTKSGIWPGYTEEIKELNLPAWVNSDDNEEEIAYVE